MKKQRKVGEGKKRVGKRAGEMSALSDIPGYKSRNKRMYSG